MKRLIALSLFFLLGHVALAASLVIVDDRDVTEAIARNAVMWDVRSAEAYARGHIAGAMNIGDAARVLRDDNTEDFIAFDRIEKMLGRRAWTQVARPSFMTAGAPGNRILAFTPSNISTAKTFVCTTKEIEGWAAAGHTTSRDASHLPPVALKLEINPTAAVTTKEMVSRLNNPDVQIIDARTPQEFSGEDIRAIRGGHIPGAVNIPYEQNWVDPETQTKLARKEVSNNAGMSLKRSVDLKQLYSRFDPKKETIVYCQSGARASETAGVLQDLGFTNVKVYNSSWFGIRQYSGRTRQQRDVF